MATKRIKDLLTNSGSLKPADQFALSNAAADADRKVTFTALLASMGFATATVGTLPTGVASVFIYVTDGLKSGETSGQGSGVLCSWGGSDWLTVDTGTAVAS